MDRIELSSGSQACKHSFELQNDSLAWRWSNHFGSGQEFYPYKDISPAIEESKNLPPEFKRNYIKAVIFLILAALSFLLRLNSIFLSVLGIMSMYFLYKSLSAKEVAGFGIRTVIRNQADGRRTSILHKYVDKEALEKFLSELKTRL